MSDLLQRAVGLEGQNEDSSDVGNRLPDDTVMTFTEFCAYWRSVSRNPPNDGVVCAFRVWCEKRNEYLDGKRASPYKDDHRKYEQHKDRYVHEHNTLRNWMMLVWEFAAGNSALRAQGRPNFLGGRNE